jgi:hypothetical protein
MRLRLKLRTDKGEGFGTRRRFRSSTELLPWLALSSVRRREVTHELQRNAYPRRQIHVTGGAHCSGSRERTRGICSSQPLLFDLLSREEAALDAVTAELRFDISFLAERLLRATYWVGEKEPHLRVGYVATNTGAAALLAAAEAQDTVGAIVSLGGIWPARAFHKFTLQHF